MTEASTICAEGLLHERGQKVYDMAVEPDLPVSGP